MKGTLYVVATPIGNLEDITLRALRILNEVDLIAAEDTRQTLKLLNHFEISKPLMSYHRHNEDIKSDILIEKLKNGENIALVSDAGTPGICDPGEEVIKKCIEEEIVVIPIPGACAMINALIASGIDTKEFCFLGFLPLNKKLRKEKIEEIKNSNKTIILYEAPHKMKNTLEDLKDILQNRKIVLAREFIVSGYRLVAVEKGGKVVAASNLGKLKTVTQMIAIVCCFLDKFSFGQFVFRVSSEAEMMINSAGIYMTTGQFIINILSTIMLVVSVIATVFSGIDYLKNGKELLKD